MTAISSFWTNTIWFVLLGVSTVVEVTVALFKTDKRGQATAFFITMFGITLTIETIILIFMKAYAYHPIIFTKTGNMFDDVLAGNLFSQVSIAATLLLTAVTRAKPKWYFVCAGLYGAIEELFLFLGIYTHNWYRTWMTIVILPMLMLLAKFMYSKIQTNIKPKYYYLYFLLAMFTMYIVFCFPVLVLRLQDWNYHVLFVDPMRSRHFLAVLEFFILSVPLMWIHFTRQPVVCKAFIFSALEILFYVSYRLNLLQIKEGRFFPYSLSIIIWMYLSTLLIDRLYKHPVQKA